MSFLAGKTVLLTGATGGIGAEVARQLSAQGARLILTGRAVEKLRALQNQLAAETLIYPCDLTRTAEQQGLLQFCQQHGGIGGEVAMLAGLRAFNHELGRNRVGGQGAIGAQGFDALADQGAEEIFHVACCEVRRNPPF